MLFILFWNWSLRVGASTFVTLTNMFGWHNWLIGVVACGIVHVKNTVQLVHPHDRRSPHDWRTINKVNNGQATDGHIRHARAKIGVCAHVRSARISHKYVIIHQTNAWLVGDRWTCACAYLQGGSPGRSLIDFLRYSWISVSALSRSRSSRLSRSELICRRGLVHSVPKVLCIERGDVAIGRSAVTSKLSRLFCRRCLRARSLFLRGSGGRPSTGASSSVELRSSVERLPYLSRSSLCRRCRSTALSRSSW